MKKIGILTSGGDAPGMNAAIRAAVRTAINYDMEVIGIKRGFEGLIDGDMIPMKRDSVGDILHRGGTILLTARSSRFMESGWQDHAIKMLEAFGIEGLIIVGGDGSLHGGLALSEKGIPVMGVPGTIDNDLAYTDSTIGFDTALNTILELISKIRDTSSSHERTIVIEVMGRECGDLALYSGICGGADVILVPEVEFDLTQMLTRVLMGHSSGNPQSIIVMAEGINQSAVQLAKLVEENTGREARAVVPGYIQRGGSPTEKDRLLASLCAAKAVELLYNDAPSKAIGLTGGVIAATDLKEALEIPRTFNREIYDLAGILSRGVE